MWVNHVITTLRHKMPKGLSPGCEASRHESQSPVLILWVRSATCS